MVGCYNNLISKMAFWYGHQKEEVYMEIPPSFESIEERNEVRKLKKTLYGLKQSLVLGLGDLGYDFLGILTKKR